MTTQTDVLPRLLAELERFDTAMLVTHGASGELHARPMVISDVGGGGELWFITNDDSPKVVEIDHDGRAVAILQSAEVYISVTGHVRTVSDEETIRSHASARAKRWLNPSHGEPTALVLHPLAAEIWDSSVTVGVRMAARKVLLRRGDAAAELDKPLVEHVVIPFPPV